MLLSDIVVDAATSSLEVLDGKSAKIIKYVFNGDFIDEWKNANFRLGKSFTKINDNLYAIYGGTFFSGKSDHRLLYVSKERRGVTSNFFPIGSEAPFDSFLERDNFWNQGDTRFMHFAFWDTVYVLQDLKPTHRWFFDFGKHQLPASVMERNFKDVLEFINYCRETNYAYQVSNISETNDHIFFMFEYEGQRRQGYYFKLSGKCKVVLGFADDSGVGNLDNETNFFRLQ